MSSAVLHRAQAHSPHLSVATGGAKLESHPIALSPMSRTPSAVIAPPTPHSPPADQQVPSATEDQQIDLHGTGQQQSNQPATAPDVSLKPAADAETDGGGPQTVADDMQHDAEAPAAPAALDTLAQAFDGENAGPEGALVAPLQNDVGEDVDARDSESDPSTPVAVREALAAVHSLAISTGATLLIIQADASQPWRSGQQSEFHHGPGVCMNSNQQSA